MKITPFNISIPQDDIDALRTRLANTRWAPEANNEDWSLGVNGTYLRQLMEYWQKDFDWRTQEARINTFPQFRTEIDEIPIHFIHVRGKGPNPTPIILNHGWPWSFWDFRDVILRLADPVSYGGKAEDAFDVVVPSLPGFTFSGPLARNDIGYKETADLWVKLMKGLGYERFVTHGGDAGAFVSARLGHVYPESIIAVHLSFPILPGVPHSAGDPKDFTPEEKDMKEQDPRPESFFHVLIHTLDPQTLAWAMHDSPVGLAAWILLRRRAWSDCNGDVETKFDKDTLLTYLSLYWFTNCFVGTELFCRASNFPQTMDLVNDIKPEISVPTAVAVMPKDCLHRPKRIVERYANLRQWTVFPSGGHFGAAEEPERMAEDIKGFLRSLRETDNSG
ncbi:epocide hydrolase domain-containing protein [Massarina eburnea CBS 473.64]|uniref:Epocide hydrolase domain-containing protein n=1 Tax=Massarina eburnea CBS 473.64 TaxID=1395130 RepID=A0A6A6S9M0_9PLEO|nr:epocide hydrolase domain-containing protein [Massarina eburnea CBS 473.64]